MISWVALDRFVEERAASDAKFRKRIAGRPLRSHAKQLTDSELLSKLGSFGIDLDHLMLGQLCDEALSAEEVAKTLLEQCNFRNRREELEGDWIWICLAALWERWFADKPCFETLDDKMQAGYDELANGNTPAACRIWLEAWADVTRIEDKAGFKSIKNFDKHFLGTQSLFNWIQDLEGELGNAGLEDKEFLVARIAVCEEGLRRFEPDGDDLLTENLRRALAESLFELGEAAKTEVLYREWLKKDRLWGWGWIGWSDCYRFTNTQLVDLNRAEQLLLEGLAVEGVRNFKDISERLSDLYVDQGRVDEAANIPPVRIDSAVMRNTLEGRPRDNVPPQNTALTFLEERAPLRDLPNVASLLPTHHPNATGSRRKVGRNDPCPCGSGKKFKKCCCG